MNKSDYLRFESNVDGEFVTFNLDINDFGLTELLRLRSELDGDYAVTYLDKLLYQDHNISKEMKRYYNEKIKENKMKKRRKLKWKYRRDK